MEGSPKVNSVRSIINLFEENCRNETSLRLNKSMSKSFSGLSFSERKFKSYASNDNDTLYNLDQRLQSLSFKLKDYRVYSKQNHVVLQDELIEIMSILCTVDIKNNTAMYKKREMIRNIRSCFKDLSNKLPGAADNMGQGFGDFTYKQYSWKRPNSVGGAILKPDELSLPPRPNNNMDQSYNTFQKSSISAPKLGESNGEAPSESVISNEKLLSPSSFRNIPDFLIGGAVGTRRPVSSIGFDTTLRGIPNDQSRTLQRSASEVTNGDDPKPPLIGNSDYAKRWVNGNQQSRRRPVSLGGTIVTLNSAEDIISSMKSQELIQNEQKPNGVGTTSTWETNGTSDDDTLQSVNLLKRFFELKSEKEETSQQKSSTEEYRRDSLEENNENSSNDTIVEEETERLSTSTWVRVDEVEGLNTPEIRREKLDEVVVLSSVDDDLEEANSYGSEQSIYLDPVDYPGESTEIIMENSNLLEFLK